MWNNHASEWLSPGANLGVLGGGQLGRMFALAARELGYQVHVFSTKENSPAGQVADSEVVGDFRDEGALRQFATRIDVATFEVETVPHEAALMVADRVPVRPDPAILRICQNRLREKSWLASAGFPVARFDSVTSRETLQHAMSQVGFPAILKTEEGGYDGKGQHTIVNPSDAQGVLAKHPGRAMIMERAVDLALECSVMVGRGLSGDVAHWGVIENRHADHILDYSVSPAEMTQKLADEAIGIAIEIGRQLHLEGVLCVEFFVDSRGRLLVNELAPRPHNSGHLTIEASPTSQFEQQVRAICGLPLGATTMVRPAAMANLLGELWQNGEPQFDRLRNHRGVYLHLYGKSEPRAGRKMGHLTALGRTRAEALNRVNSARQDICTSGPTKSFEFRHARPPLVVLHEADS